MGQNQVKFTIKPGGQINMEVIGGQGQSCTEVTKELELHLAAAGAKQKEGGKTPDYYKDGPNLDAFNTLTN